MRVLGISLCIAAAVGATACKRTSHDEGTVSAAPATVPETTSMPSPGTTASGINLSGLGDQLHEEASNRPRAGVTVEQVFDALDRIGIKTGPRKQLLGMAVNARYCANTRVPNNLTVVVCEYSDAATAESSTAAVEKRFAAATANVTRKVHGSTVIAVMGIDRTNNRGDADRILSTFATL